MADRLFEATLTQFFDRKAVTRALDREKKKRLSRAGAFVRTRARSSIRRRKGTSRPGRPPFSHEGSLRRLLLFAYDRGRDTVVVGPVPFRQARQTAPQLLEHGGQTRAGRRTLTYLPRPFMAPALEAETKAGTLAGVWANSVKG